VHIVNTPLVPCDHTTRAVRRRAMDYSQDSLSSGALVAQEDLDFDNTNSPQPSHFAIEPSRTPLGTCLALRFDFYRPFIV
jgi:hypothetical protein